MEFDQSMWGARRRVLKIKSLKHGIIQDKRGNIMRTVFGIDVSKASSEVAILVNGEKIHGYTMLNDAIGFNRLLNDLKTVHNPEIILKLLVSILGVFKPFLRNTAMLIHS